MKRIYIYLLTAVMALNSCQSWLDIMPENDQISAEYWKTKEEVEAVLGAGYVRLRQSIQQILVWGDLRSNTLQITGVLDVNLYRMKVWDILPQNDFCQWDKFYQVINNANMVIKYAPEVVEIDPSFNTSVMESYLSEAYFQRALAYFYLVRNFREVPLILEPYMNDSQDYEIPKSSEEELFNQIISDLETAKGASKEIWPNLWEMKGRSTTWSINALLADVYLWTGDYEKSIEACDNVINSGRVGLISGMANAKNNWFTIFNPGNSNESIFELQFDFLSNQNNPLMTWFYNQNNYLISNHMIGLFMSSPEDIRGANATFNPNTFRIFKYYGAEVEGGIPRANSDQNWIIYRMADIYLMKAEALIMQGEDNYAEAIEILNLIRERAGISLPLQVLSSELDMLNLVVEEKAREFVAEGKSWYDILRVAKRNNYQYKDYLIDQVLLGSTAASIPIIRSKLMDINSHYLPIHFSELQVNKQLVQNPYYENLN